MANKIYYTVVEDYNGQITVSGFGGSTTAEERTFAKSLNRRVIGIYTNHDQAQARAQFERQNIRSKK